MRGFSFFVVNRVQRKVLQVVVVIIVVPMLIASLLSASWIADHMNASIEHWIREAAQVNRNWLETIQVNATTLADLYEEMDDNREAMPSHESLISEKMRTIAQQLGLNLIQIYDAEGQLRYSSPAVTLDLAFSSGVSMAVVRAMQGTTRLLAAVRIEPFPRHGVLRYRLVMGTLFDKSALERLNQMSGLRTRLFYPDTGGFTKAFSVDRPLLEWRLPPEAFANLMNRRE